MAVAQLKSPPSTGAQMDRPIAPSLWTRWPLGVRAGAGGAFAIAAVLMVVALVFGDGVGTLRVRASDLTIATAARGVFHDLMPLRAKVVPRDTIYLDAIEGGRIERVLVEPGQVVAEGDRLLEFGNTNLQLQVIQQESQLNQAISQLQQNEIALEQSKIANDKSIAQIEYDIVRLSRSLERRDRLAAQGAVAIEQRDVVSDELNHDRIIKPMQAASNARQEALRARLLPAIEDQLENLARNLQIVRTKLDSLIVRSPVAGRVTDIDLKIGENRSAGQRLLEITPDTGYKLSAEIDEFYLARVRLGQHATMELNGRPIGVRIARIYPQVKDGRFTIDLAFEKSDPAGLVTGEAMQGHLALGDDRAALLIPAGPYLDRTGGDWIFVVNGSGTAERRRIRLGRRNTEQVEIVGGVEPGERVVTSDYTGFDRIDRILLSK